MPAFSCTFLTLIWCFIPCLLAPCSQRTAQYWALCIPYRAQPTRSAPRRAAHQAFALLPAHGGEQLESARMLLHPLIPLILSGNHYDGSSRPELEARLQLHYCQRTLHSSAITLATSKDYYSRYITRCTPTMGPCIARCCLVIAQLALARNSAQWPGTHQHCIVHVEHI